MVMFNVMIYSRISVKCCYVILIGVVTENFLTRVEAEVILYLMEQFLSITVDTKSVMTAFVDFKLCALRVSICHS